MVNSDPRSGDLTLLSDGSSPANSTGNTPDSGDALDSSESFSIDRRISKESKSKKSGTNLLKTFVIIALCTVKTVLLFCVFIIYFKAFLFKFLL